MKAIWLPIVALAVSVAACQQQQGEQMGETMETAAVDAATVEQTIRDGLDRYEQAALAGDTETLVSLYTDDAILLPAGMPKSQGIDAIRTAYQQMYATGAPTAFSLEQSTIVVSESVDLAYEVGTFSMSFAGPEGQSVTDTGKYVAIWEPTATGDWKIAVDIWNSDAMPGATTETAAPAGQ